MRTGAATFKIDTSFIGRFGSNLSKKTIQYDKQLEKRMKLATDMIWRIAHQKRPMISVAQMKAEGRTHRVSDPNAEAGVPVAEINGGRLQASITQKVHRNRLMNFTGTVATKGVEYATFVEYGTSKMRARPFMRPAITLTQDAIKRMFGMKIESNL